MEEFLWVEKYRPKTITDTILTSELKSVFQKFIDQNNIPNLILSGTPGIGKTTVAKAMLEQLGCDYIMINGSLSRNIDTLRNEILDFASTVSFSGTRKYVILDEADYLNANSTQPALRNFMEEFSKNCGFILTCNYKNRIIDPLQSRCSLIDFNISKKDMPKLASCFFKRIQKILESENIEYDKNTVVQLITKHFPDWRRIINELQKYSATGKIDSGIFVNSQDISLKELVSLMKNKNYSGMRNWLYSNSDMDINDMYRKFYDIAYDIMDKNSVPCLVLAIAKYQYQHAFAANADINFMAFLTEVMVECSFNE